MVEDTTIFSIKDCTENESIYGATVGAFSRTRQRASPVTSYRGQRGFANPQRMCFS